MNEDTTAVSSDLIELAAEIVAAYVSNNSVPVSELPGLIASTHAAMAGLDSGISVKQPEIKPVPVVSIRKSITPDYLICLEDGKKFKSLKRHLSTHYGLTPDAYRQKWNLPSDYPMVAPNYSASRSALARSVGLGRKPAPVEVPPPPAPKRKKLGLKFG